MSENSEIELACRRATAEISQTLRELAANLIRVIRGAGKPYEIAGQAISFVEALIAYDKATGDFPTSYVLADALSIELDTEHLKQMISSGHWHEYSTEQQIICGALQVVASRLLGQRTQQRAGEHEMHLGIRDLAEIRSMRRQKSASPTWRRRRVGQTG